LRADLALRTLGASLALGARNTLRPGRTQRAGIARLTFVALGTLRALRARRTRIALRAFLVPAEHHVLCRPAAIRETLFLDAVHRATRDIARVEDPGRIGVGMRGRRLGGGRLRGETRDAGKRGSGAEQMEAVHGFVLSVGLVI
jgi:hypothetical protein